MGPCRQSSRPGEKADMIRALFNTMCPVAFTKCASCHCCVVHLLCCRSSTWAPLTLLRRPPRFGTRRHSSSGVSVCGPGPGQALALSSWFGWIILIPLIPHTLKQPCGCADTITQQPAGTTVAAHMQNLHTSRTQSLGEISVLLNHNPVPCSSHTTG